MTTLTSFRHTFSHFHLNIQPVLIDVKSGQNMVKEGDNRRWVPIRDPGALGLPRPVERLLRALNQSEFTKTGEQT